MCLAYTPAFHEYLILNSNVSKAVNFILDNIFLPLGIVKILIQICTIIFAKKTTGISITYFSISSFFTLITSLSLNFIHFPVYEFLQAQL